MTKHDEYKKGDIIKARVSGITDFGIFVRIDDKYVGLIHKSFISEKFVKDPKDYASIGDVINTEILDIDKKSHKMKLSIKNIRYKDKFYIDRRIVETSHGFSTLKSNLPIWIEKNLKCKKTSDFLLTNNN